jgi:hypothetical protein
MSVDLVDSVTTPILDTCSTSQITTTNATNNRNNHDDSHCAASTCIDIDDDSQRIDVRDFLTSALVTIDRTMSPVIDSQLQSKSRKARLECNHGDMCGLDTQHKSTQNCIICNV